MSEQLNNRSLKSAAQIRLLIAVSALAVIIRIAAIYIWGSEIEETVYEYDPISRNIAAGLGYSWDLYGSTETAPTAWMAPVYTYMLAAYYWIIGDNLTGMAIFQAVAGGITCLLIGLVGNAVSNVRTGLIAAALFAIYPEMILLPLKFVDESWLLLWMLCIVYLGALYLQTGNRRIVILAGIFSGIASLTHESALICPIALMIWVLLKRGLSRRWLIDSLLLLSVTIVVIAPWTVRNYLVFDKFVLIRTNFWVNAWRGNFPGATGTPRNFNNTLHDLALDPEYRAVIDPQLVGDEIQREEVYKKLAIRHITEDPVRYIGLTLRRMQYFWTVDPTHPLTGHPLYWAPWFLLIILSLIGAISVRKHWQDYSFWYLIFIITTVVYSLMLVLPRYRIPLLPGLMLLAAEGLRRMFISAGKTNE